MRLNPYASVAIRSPKPMLFPAGVGYAARALGEVTLSLTMQVAFDTARVDILVAMVTLRMGDEQVQHQFGGGQVKRFEGDG